MAKVLNKYKVFNELNEEIKDNIKFFHIFNNNNRTNEKNIILVTNDDKVYCFGSNVNGVLGFGHSNRVKEFIINEDLSNKQIIQFYNTSYHTTARTLDGKLYCFGDNTGGNFGNGRKGISGKTYKPELNKYLLNENVIDVSCGYSHTLVLTSNGEVYKWNDKYLGFKRKGLLGKYIPRLKPFKMSYFDGKNVKAVSCGFGHSLVLTENGRVFIWDDLGMLGIRNNIPTFQVSLKLIKLDKTIIIDKISCGRFHSLLLSRNKDIYVFGNDEHDQLGSHPKRFEELIPIKLNYPVLFVEIASNYRYSFSSALSDNGLYYAWGDCGWEGIISEPKVTEFTSFQELFDHYFGIIPKVEFLRTTKDTSTYLKLSDIGSGSFGTVFKAKHRLDYGGDPGMAYTVVGKGDVYCRVTERLYAIKKISMKDKNSINEIEMAAHSILDFRHENLVWHYGVWIEKDHTGNFFTYIRMELCDKTLPKVHGEIREDPDLFLNDSFTRLGFYILSEIFIQILKGVNYLHNKSIIHRDLKPDNILVKNGTIKIGDFGLAKFHDLNEVSNRLNSGDIGTIKYAASEVLECRHYDTKSDIYSLGVILMELFEFNEDRFNQYINDDLLKQKFETLGKLIERMKSENQEERPVCEKILEEREDWGLNGREIETDQEMIILLNSDNEKTYVQNMIVENMHSYSNHELEQNEAKKKGSILVRIRDYFFEKFGHPRPRIVRIHTRTRPHPL